VRLILLRRLVEKNEDWEKETSCGFYGVDSSTHKSSSVLVIIGTSGSKTYVTSMGTDLHIQIKGEIGRLGIIRKIRQERGGCWCLVYFAASVKGGRRNDA